MSDSVIGGSDLWDGEPEAGSRPADFASLKVGDQVTLRREFAAADVEAFARLSGDFNPLHVDGEFARRTRFRGPVAHGMLAAAYISSLVGMQLPGPGAVWLQQSFDFVAPVFIGEEIEFRLRVEHKSVATRTVLVRVEARNRQGAVVVRGQGKVMVPAP